MKITVLSKLMVFALGLGLMAFMVFGWKHWGFDGIASATGSIIGFAIAFVGAIVDDQ